MDARNCFSSANAAGMYSLTGWSSLNLASSALDPRAAALAALMRKSLANSKTCAVSNMSSVSVDSMGSPAVGAVVEGLRSCHGGAPAFICQRAEG